MQRNEPYDEENHFYEEGYPLDPEIEDVCYHKEYIEDIQRYEDFPSKKSIDLSKYKLQKITTVSKNDKGVNNLPKFDCPVYTGKSKTYNLYKYVYGRLYASLYETGTCEIIEKTGIIYSWATWLLGLYNRKHILWFDIKNVDETHSKLTYIFNDKNRIPEYEDYLASIAYRIDNNL